MKITMISAVLAALLLAGCGQRAAVPAVGEHAPGMSGFDRAFQSLMARWDIPGGALAVMEDGEVVLSRGYGYADVDEAELVRANSLFRIASVSKPVTAVAVLKLVEEGKLALDTPAFSVLGALEPLEGASVDPRIRQITVRHLLEHAGGWDAGVAPGPMFRTSEIAREMGMLEPATCERVIRYMLGQPLDFEPGSAYAYSNFGYCVLGRVIERVAGQGYEEYVRQHVLEPAGIERMRLGRTRLADREPGEVRYYDEEGAPDVRPIFPEMSALVPAPYGGFYLEAMDANGGWIASANDLARFAWSLEAGVPDRILKAETVTQMLARPAAPLWEGSSSYYGLGWRVRLAGSSANWWHTGSMPGSTAVLYRSSNGLIWAALFNMRPDSEGDEFLVDVITSMGRAAMVRTVLWPAVIGIVLIAGIASLVVALARGRKRGGHHG